MTPRSWPHPTLQPDGRALRRRDGRRTRPALAGGCALTVLALLAASAGPATARGGEGLGDPLPDVPRSGVTVSLTTVTEQVVAPVAGITTPDNARELFVVDQIGLLHVIDVSDEKAWPVSARTVLDVSGLLAGPSRYGDERGFLGAAFAPGDASTHLHLHLEAVRRPSSRRTPG